ncbi:MAG: IS3 family transposase [Acidobacteriota bacterium]|nr:IS3 family transposase [Acidobacteriota bacterium]
MGYRRIRDELEKHQGIDVNDKRILRICRKNRSNLRSNGNRRAAQKAVMIRRTSRRITLTGISTRMLRIRNG